MITTVRFPYMLILTGMMFYMLHDFVLCEKGSKVKNAIKSGSTLLMAGKNMKHGGHRSGFRFPIWGIILVVMGSSVMVALVIFLFCYLHKRRSSIP